MPFTKRPPRARTLCAGLLAAVLLSAAVPAFASACPSSTLSRPFAALGDNAYYALVRGGTFEAGAPEWLTDGSEIVAEEESVTHDRHALVLGSWANVSSAPFCASSEYPSFRFMARRKAGSGRIYVGLSWKNAAGEEHSTSVASFEPASSWKASPVLALASNLPLSEGASIEPVRLTFSTHTRGLSIAISAVYIDPYSR